MKIVFNRQKILNDAAPLMCAVSNKASVHAIEGILIEAKEPGECVMTTFDTEKGVRLNVEAQVFEGGSYVINAQKFMNTLKVMPGSEVTLTVDDTLKAVFTSGTSTHKMNAAKGSDFPEIPKLRTSFGFTVSQHIVREMITKCSHAMAVADPRPILNGCYFYINNEKLLTVACDSFRLAKCTVRTELENNNENQSDLKFSFIIPARTMNELYRLLDSDEEKNLKMRIYMSRHQIVFIIGRITFFSALIEGQYMDYNRIISVPNRTVIVLDREELIEALERAALITEEKIAGSVRAHVKFSIEDGFLHINAESTAGSTYDRIAIDHEGEDVTLAFNNRYLLDALRACTGEKVRITISSPLSGIDIEPWDEEDRRAAQAGPDTPDERVSTELFFLLPVRMKS